jgi:hypothetical protein
MCFSMSVANGVFARGKGDLEEMMKWRAWSRESSLSGAQRTILHQGT